MNIVIIVQARMNSTRLPGKVMKKVMDKTLLEYFLERLQRVEKCNMICVATPMHSGEQPILDVCSQMSVRTFQGSENDVLERYFLAAQELKADVILRATSDCPLIDPVEIDKLVEYYLKNSNKYDYVSTGLERSYPRGMDAEIFSFKALEKAYKNSASRSEREHVTPYLYKHPEVFNLKNFSYKEDLKDYRWTVDTPEDFELIQKIIECLYPDNPEFTIEDILDLCQRNPEWKEINSHVRQKAVNELEK